MKRSKPKRKPRRVVIWNGGAVRAIQLHLLSGDFLQIELPDQIVRLVAEVLK